MLPESQLSNVYLQTRNDGNKIHEDRGMENKNKWIVNPLNAELNPIRHLLALLGAHHIPHVSRIRVNSKYHDLYK